MSFGYALPYRELTREQAEYIHKTLFISVDVLGSPFGDTSAIDRLKAHAALASGLFGEDALKHAAEILWTGGNVSAFDRGVLSVLHYVIELAAAGSIGTFVEYFNHFDTYYGELMVPYYAKYDLE